MVRLIVCLLVIFLLSWVALRSLLSVPFYTSHDGFTHTARIAAYYDSLKDGQFPVRWAKNLNGNLGSPIFVYSYPLVYLAGAGLHFLSISYENSFRILMGLPYLLSGLAAFWWLKNRFGNLAATVGAVFYLWAPYRFLDVYVRGALAENLAYTFLPLILLGIDKCFQKRGRWWWALLYLSTTAMFLSHNLVSAIFLPIIFVWTGLLFLQTKDRRLTIWVLSAVGLAFLTSAFIYFPDLFERQFIRFDKGISYWPDHFVAFWQVVKSKWDYGFDLPGAVNDAMSFQLGLAHWLVLTILAIVLGFKTWRKRRFLLQKENWPVILLVLIFAVILILAVEHPASKIIWQTTPFMKTIVDFPWRFLGLLTIVMAFLTAYLIHITKNSKFLTVLLLAAVLIANRNHLRVNEAVTYGDAAYDNYTGTATATSNEYGPIWHQSQQIPLNSSRVDILEGNYQIRVNSVTSSGLDFDVVATTAGVIRVNRFYFPKTLIYRDGELLKSGQDWKIIDDTGTIKLLVAPPGGHYEVRFEDTDLRKSANVISVGGLLTALLVFWRLSKK